MRTLTYLIFKYWRKHKKNALALIFSSSMIVAVIFFTLLLVREEFNRSLQSMFDSHGNAEYIVGNSNDELLAYIVGDKTDFDVSSIYVNGEIYAGMDKIPYGTVEDESGIIRIPVKTGRLPEGPDEAAIEEGAAQKLRWLGRVGDTLEIDGKRYTVTGIIDKAYGERKGAPFSFAMQNDHTKYPLPLIFTGQTDSSPIYRIDHLSGLYDASAYEMNYAYANKLMENDEIMNRVLSLYLEQSEQYEAGEEPNWFDWTGGDYRQLSITEHFEYQRKMEGNETGFFLRIFTLGAIVAVLSVFSVLRNIFIERRSRTQILRRIGMSDRRIGAMYVIECFLMIILQTTAGLLFGCAIYGAVFAFRVNVLGYPPYSGFTANSYISVFSPDPFIVSVAASVAIMALAYLITVLTTKAKRKPPRKNVKPRSLPRCFSGIFRQRTVSMIQTAALVLICFSTVFSYMYYTDSGKNAEEGYASFNGGSWDHWSKSTAEYYVDGLDMEAEGIEAYYFADDMPFFGSIESYGNLKNAMYFAPSRYGSGIDDSLADALPDYAVVVGYIENPFIICDEPNSLYSNKIEFFEQDEKNLILQLSDQEYQNFFDEGQLGTKYLYQAKTKLTRASLILSLQQYVKQGEINIDKLNSGEEVIAVVSAGKSPFEAGETLHLGMATDDSGSGCGISRIDHADVKIGAVVLIPPSIDTVTGRALKSDFGDNSGAEPPYNLLTTATGAGNMGMSCASYTKIYCMGDMDGGLIPANSGMSVTYLDDMKRDNFLTQASKLGGSVLVLTVMLMLGFAAYFNGIGIKIRLKAYDISVLRALGTPIKKIKNKLMLASMKIPIAASAISFVLLSAYRALTEYASHIPDLHLQMTSTEEVYTLQQIPWKTAAEVFFWYNRWWRADPILPTLAVLLIIGSISLLLTHRAFKKFNSDISASLNEGRTRQ